MRRAKPKGANASAAFAAGADMHRALAVAVLAGSATIAALIGAIAGLAPIAPGNTAAAASAVPYPAPSAGVQDPASQCRTAAGPDPVCSAHWEERRRHFFAGSAGQ